MTPKRLFIYLSLFFQFFCFANARMGVAQVLTFPDYQLIVESEQKGDKPFALNKHQTLLVSLKPISTTKDQILDLKFDARMPQHKHGMVTQAKVVRLEPFKYQIQGVRLHMPGEWVLEFVIQDKKGQTRIEVPWLLSAQ